MYKYLMGQTKYTEVSPFWIIRMKISFTLIIWKSET